MRNLKKVLSLALALVMLLGMMVVGAGAATEFKDASSIPENRAVAVAVANALEVLLGDENGNFNPDKTLTRAEAAVVLTKLDLGASAANALTATNAASFDDVGTGYGWAKAYIDYCAGNGYMVGVGGNRFAPAQTLTSVEFGLMVSRVLGYRDANEGITGDAWSVKAAALARKAGLGTDVSVGSNQMTRADMAQMVLNALTAPMVEYTGLNGSIGDATFNSPATTRKHANDTGRGDIDYKGDLIQPNITPIRLCEERFPYLKLSTTAEDSFGHTASVWKNRNVEIKGSTTTVEPDITITGKITDKAPAWADIKGLELATKKDDGKAAEIWVNGEFDPTYITSVADKSGSDYASTSLRGQTGNGRLVEIYLNEAKLDVIDKIVITDTALAEVTKVMDADEKISVKLVDTANAAIENGQVLTTDKGYGDFKKGDLVLVTAYNATTGHIGKSSTIASVEEPTIVTDFARKKGWNSDTAGAYIQMDGSTDPYYDAMSVMTKYDVSAFETNNKKLDSTLYLDKYGYIMKAVSGVVTNKIDDNLVAVVNRYKTLTNGQIVEMAQVMRSDGSLETLAINDASSNAQKNDIAYFNDDPGNSNLKILTKITAGSTDAVISITATDVKNFLAWTVDDGSQLTFKSNDVFGKKNADTYMYSDTVKFIFVSSEGVVKANGRQNYVLNPTGGTGNADTVLAQALNSKGEITAVFVGAKSDVVETTEIIYVHSDYREWDEIKDLEDGKQVKLYGYTAYTADGEPIEPFVGVSDDMAYQFFKKDLNEYDAQKKTQPDVIQTHTMLEAEVLNANGTSGDAFTVQDVLIRNGVHGAHYGEQTTFISRNTKVVDLSGDGYNIDRVSEINGLANSNKTVTVALIFDATDAENPDGSKVKLAKTVFVLDVVEDKEATPIISGNNKTLETIVSGDTQAVVAGKKLTVEGDVSGAVNAEGDSGHPAEVVIDGGVKGSVNAKAYSDVTVGSVEKDGSVTVAANATLTVEGDVKGTITAAPGATIKVEGECKTPIEVTVPSSGGTQSLNDVVGHIEGAVVNVADNTVNWANGCSDSNKNKVFTFAKNTDTTNKQVLLTITDSTGKVIYQEAGNGAGGAFYIPTEPLGGYTAATTSDKVWGSSEYVTANGSSYAFDHNLKAGTYTATIHLVATSEVATLNPSATSALAIPTGATLLMSGSFTK